jgi:hypothetical protein
VGGDLTPGCYEPPFMVVISLPLASFTVGTSVRSGSVSLSRTMCVSVSVLLLVQSAVARAQDRAAPPQARDTSAQGYAPAQPAPAAAPAPAPAAAPAAPNAATPVAASAAAGIGAQLGFVDVLPTRSPERIKSLMDNAVALEREAGIDLANAQSEKMKTKALIDSKKQEISIIDSKRKTAEKSKQEGEKIAFEAEKKDAELQKTFLERRANLHDAEIERAKALQKMATASTRALQLEQELGLRRADRTKASAADPAGARRQDAVIAELEGRGLEAKRLQAEAEKTVADKDVDLARRRIELHKAQTSASSSGSR